MSLRLFSSYLTMLSKPNFRYTSFMNRIDPISLQRFTAVPIIFSSSVSSPLLMYIQEDAVRSCLLHYSQPCLSDTQKSAFSGF